MRYYCVHSRIDDAGAPVRLFRRDYSVKPMRRDSVRHGVLVTGNATAAEAYALKFARGYDKTAEAMIRQDGYTANGGEIFVAEVWTRGRSRLLGIETFAIIPE